MSSSLLDCTCAHNCLCVNCNAAPVALASIPTNVFKLHYVNNKCLHALIFHTCMYLHNACACMYIISINFMYYRHQWMVLKCYWKSMKILRWLQLPMMRRSKLSVNKPVGWYKLDTMTLLGKNNLFCIQYLRWNCFVYYSIANRRNSVVARRQKVKQMSAERKAHIKASLAWQQFCRDADEVSEPSS